MIYKKAITPTRVSNEMPGLYADKFRQLKLSDIKYSNLFCTTNLQAFVLFFLTIHDTKIQLLAHLLVLQ